MSESIKGDDDVWSGQEKRHRSTFTPDRSGAGEPGLTQFAQTKQTNAFTFGEWRMKAACHGRWFGVVLPVERDAP